LVEDEVEVVGGAHPLPFDVIKRRIAAHLRGTRVQRAIVFGSYARGSADSESDLDLVLIERTSRPFLERGRAHLALFRLPMGLDLLVYTPEEHERLKQEESPLIDRVEREGVVVYERSEG
jgi:predicted nucleotidyltransferase